MSATIEIREATRKEIKELIPLLLLAEPHEPSLRWSLKNLSDAVYRLDVEDAPAAAATVRWRGEPEEPAEIVELGVARDRQGEGLGRALVAWLVDEARRRGKHAIEVGTGNASLGNIAFYQKCGFRMERVKRDYFWYNPEPNVIDGIPERDLLMFRYDLVPRPAPPRPSWVGRRRK